VADASPDLADASPADAAVLSMADAGIDAGTPDLTVYGPRTDMDLAIEERHFEANACELTPQENCVAAPGDRTLLRFSVETPNIGEGDFFLGAPNTSRPEFQYSPCHEHFHFLGYAVFRLLDGDGMEVVEGNKQAFCLVDSQKFWTDGSAAPFARYNCGYQGLQPGWSDVYDSSLPCQFLDVTDVAAGSYTLAIEVNAEGLISELDTANNLIEIPVQIGDPDLLTPTESCPVDAPVHATATESRECGWTRMSDLSAPTDEFECVPGEFIRVGCSANCGLGLCTGDPMLRVCDAARPDGNCSRGAALGHGDNNCGSICPRTELFRCPDSGRLAVFAAPKIPGAEYTCDLQIGTFN